MSRRWTIGGLVLFILKKNIDYLQIVILIWIQTTLMIIIVCHE